MEFRIRKEINQEDIDVWKDTKPNYDGKYWVEPKNIFLRFIVWCIPLPFFENATSCHNSKEEAIRKIKRYNSGYFKSKNVIIER